MRWIPIAIVLFSVGCAPSVTAVPGFDAGGVDCRENTPPYVGGVEMNSQETGDGFFLLSLSFLWSDPGLNDSSDLQNMRGGYISGEALGFSFGSSWFMPEQLDTGCIDPVDHPGACLNSGHGRGDEPGDVETPDGHQGCGDSSDGAACQSGEMTFFYAGEDGLQQYQDITLEFRVRDRCGELASFEVLCDTDESVLPVSKLVNYEIGSGLRTDGCGDGT